MCNKYFLKKGHLSNKYLILFKMKKKTAIQMICKINSRVFVVLLTVN